MIDFKNEKQILEWLVLAENHFTELKASLECEKNACRFVERDTKGLSYREDIKKQIEMIKSCLNMINSYINEQ